MIYPFQPFGAAKQEKNVKTTTLDQIPGYASNVWGGYVWIDGNGNEQRWSKRATQSDCESVVLETCNRIGTESAFA